MKCFILAGQSNMAGRGRMNEVETILNSQIKMLRDGKWVEMREPIHQDSPEAGIGPGASFALEYVKCFEEEIGLVPCAVGGTSITEWQEDQPLFRQMMDKIASVPEDDEIIGILWAQGETDSRMKDSALNYAALFYRMLAEIDRRLPSNETPVILADIPPFYHENEAYMYAGTVSEQIRRIAASSKRFDLTETDGLKPKDDGLHYNSVSYRELGRRMFKTYLRLTGKGECTDEAISVEQ